MTTVTLTPEMLANVMIIASPSRNPEAPHMCAVAYQPEHGPRVILADELENRKAAERWLTYQKRTVSEPEEV